MEPPVMKATACAAGIICLHAASSAAATFQTFNLPDGQPTCGFGIASNGTIVGGTQGLDAPAENFTWRNGRFTLRAPSLPAGQVSLAAINAHGTIVGFDLIAGANLSLSSLAFTLSGKTVTMLTLPNASSIEAVGINDAGTIVGNYTSSSDGRTLGFIDDGQHLASLDSGLAATLPVGIDAAGTTLVGDTLTQGGSFAGFLYRHGRFTSIAYPNAFATFIGGISKPNVVYGSYAASTGTTSVIHGFIYRRGTYSSFDVHGANNTQIHGANESGAFTGCFTDAAGTHGYVYTP
jgi:uncharacterized membrane protein